MRVALLFIDGVGVGLEDPSRNPLARAPYLLSQFQGGGGTPLGPEGRRYDLDTTFGVSGRPQSASNQTAIFTGQPAPQLLGKHVLGFPTAPLRALLQEHSLVRRLGEAGKRATFANAYPAEYLDALGLAHLPSRGADLEIPPARLRKVRASASTLTFAAGAVPLRTFDAARAGKGLTHDIDGSQAARHRVDLPQRTPEEAAAIFWALAEDFTLFEHHLADEAGHAQDFAAAQRALDTFDRFLRAVVAQRPGDAQVLVVSDHGNVEDLSARTHTLHQVALLSFGPAHPALGPDATVAQTTPAVLHALGAA